jgi:hypothetical protein
LGEEQWCGGGEKASGGGKKLHLKIKMTPPHEFARELHALKYQKEKAGVEQGCLEARLSPQVVDRSPAASSFINTLQWILQVKA